MSRGPQRWDIADLRGRLCGVLEIAHRSVAILGTEGYVDTEDPSVSVSADKVLSETSLLLVMAAPLAGEHPEVGERVHATALVLARLGRSERIRAAVCVDPSHALDYSFTHVCLTFLGYPDEAFDRLLELTPAAHGQAGPERPPHRRMEQAWARGLWRAARLGRPEPMRSSDSALAWPLDALAATRDDVYAFTHALMYLTDLGRRAVRLPRSRRSVLADAEVALARCLQDEDYDLGGEVLLAWPLLRAQWSAAAVFALRVLTEVEDEAGFLPSQLVRFDRYQALTGDERAKYALASAYHTAYVMGLVCAIALVPGCTPPAQVPVGHRTGDAMHAKELFARMAAEGTARWHVPFLSLSDAQQVTLAPLLFAMATQRAAARRDMARLYELVRIGARLGPRAGPVLEQSVAMLRRAVLSTDPGPG